MDNQLDNILEYLGSETTEQMVIDEFSGKTKQAILDTLNEWFPDDENEWLAEDIHDWLRTGEREAEINLYEDNAGGLHIAVADGYRSIYWSGLGQTDGNFISDAQAIAMMETDDWTVEMYDGEPAGEHVATYQGSRITWISKSLGRAAERYIGRSPLSVAEAAEYRCVAKRTVNKWISDQGLPARKIGNQYVIRLEDVLAFEPAPVGRPS